MPASHVLHSHEPLKWMAARAPDPEEVFWPNLSVADVRICICIDSLLAVY